MQVVPGSGALYKRPAALYTKLKAAAAPICSAVKLVVAALNLFLGQALRSSGTGAGAGGGEACKWTALPGAPGRCNHVHTFVLAGSDTACGYNVSSLPTVIYMQKMRT